VSTPPCSPAARPLTGVRVPGAADLADGERRAVAAGNRRFVVVRDGDDRFACENRCLHLGVRLSAGVVHGSVLECRWHHWRYDLRSGTVEADDSPFASFETFAVVVDGPDLVIEAVPRTSVRRRPPCAPDPAPQPERS
jgi:nitrite reductase/ring-hydroxylating ferredoxin subunit